MSRKGVAMIKMILFLVGSLLVGALVIFVFSNVVGRLMHNAEEQVAAKDIGLTIMTLSASPNDIVYRYDKNTENYEVRITQNEVDVTSKSGSGKYIYIPMTGITVNSALIENALIIPMTLKNKKLSFSDDKISYTDACSAIPSNFNSDAIKVKVTVSPAESSASAQKLEEIKSLMQLYSTQANSKVEFADSGEDLDLILQTGSGPQIKYYENTEDQTFSWYHRTACYIGTEFNSGEKFKKDVGTASISASSEKSITIIFGDTSKFMYELNNDTQLSAGLSRGIYNAIGSGISN